MADLGSANRWYAGLLGLLGLIALWWIAGALDWFSGTIPTPGEVISTIVDTGAAFYVDNFSSTVELAARGFLWGNGLAIGLAVLVVLIPPIEGLATQLAIISYCTPIIAVAPIIQVAFAEVQTMIVFLAAISVFFTTMIGTLTGLRSPHQSSLDLVKVYGGGRATQLWRVRSVAAVPNTLAAVKIAAPAAVLGAVLGEFLAMPDTGAGPAMIVAQQRGDIPAVWAIALISGAIAGIAYAAISVVARFATRWSAGLAVLR
ncbi:ABC transporter permease subunit [Gordonia sp. Z-3]|uniref:ABC transporter permease subunit n=2 Tax=Gordonia TaxID=2053 RepID=A0A9X3I5X1_9ACTN|nr:MULTISPECIES: ABC transporter permease subunit [Gordonia]MCF3937204.1 ABC transporter permease subunit [Gordonia tangerina]MCX2965696.1 ABC transporter permease subunit [Gordonia aquimaris]MED5803001.1 ABC transporter permease subunit [Gordonia sp. Z-3]